MSFLSNAYYKFVVERNISKMHIFKAVQWMTVSMVHVASTAVKNCSIFYFLKEGYNKQNRNHRSCPHQTTQTTADYKSAAES